MDRRPRRNSDSSVVDSDKLLTEEEKKAREARRQARQRDAAKDRAKPVNRKLDLIDQLDATSIYGTGCMCPRTDMCGMAVAMLKHLLAMCISHWLRR